MPRTVGSGGQEQFPRGAWVEGDIVDGDSIQGRVGTYRKEEEPNLPSMVPSLFIMEDLKSFVKQRGEENAMIPHDEVLEKISTLIVNADPQQKKKLYFLMALVEGDQIRFREPKIYEREGIATLTPTVEERQEKRPSIHYDYLLEKIDRAEKYGSSVVRLLDSNNLARYHELISQDPDLVQEVSSQ